MSPSTSASSTASTTAPASAPARCQPAQLSAAPWGTTGAAGTLELTVSLRNVGPAACALDGYPGAQLANAAGQALPTSVIRGGTSSFTDQAPVAVVLEAGQSAYVDIGYSDVPTGTTPCESASVLWLTPPDDVTYVAIDASVTACDGGTVTVSPVLGAGSPGSQTTAPS